MIHIENLYSQKGQFTLHNINLQVKSGDYFVILGPTGSGKTLLVEHIAGIYKTDDGRIFIGGEDITFLPPEKRRIGYSPQDFVLFPFLDVKSNIEFGARLNRRGQSAVSSQQTAVGNPQSAIRNPQSTITDAYLVDIIKKLKLENLLERNTTTLSGGEKQRVTLARALAIKPLVLLLDEPFSAIDPGLRYKLWLEMKRIHSELKTTVIHITHNLEEAFTLADRMAVMMQGTIVQSGAREEVFYSPRTKNVAEFLGVHNIFRGNVKRLDKNSNSAILEYEGFIVVAPFKENLSIGDEVDFCIRPQEIKVLKPSKPIKENLRDNIFSGIVLDSIPHGNSFTFYFKSDMNNSTKAILNFEISLPTYAYEKMNIAVGRKIEISLRKQSILILDKE